METNYGEAILVGVATTYPDFVFAQQPKPPSQIVDTSIIQGGQSTASITGSVGN